MVTAVTSYKTSDGKVFNTEIEAAGHEKFLSVQPQVEAYIAASGASKVVAGLLRKQIPGFLAFIEANPQ